MTDPVQDLAQRLATLLPPGLKTLRAELEDNFKTVLKSHLDKLDLVSRERFDVQAEVLQRALARLKTLEARVQQLEGGKP